MTQKSLPNETVRALQELGFVLKAIFLRLEKQGFSMCEGKIVHLQT